MQNPIQTIEEKRKLPNSFYEINITMTLGPEKKRCKKGQLQTSVHHEYRLKNSYQMLSSRIQKNKIMTKWSLVKDASLV